MSVYVNSRYPPMLHTEYNGENAGVAWPCGLAFFLLLYQGWYSILPSSLQTSGAARDGIYGRLSLFIYRELIGQEKKIYM